ncbi:hypothetical protein NL676_021954 [Syzygium grande]|nr:hypothetical protein NL676_021954 [Syzygium grande]
MHQMDGNGKWIISKREGGQNGAAYIGVELADEAREVVVLEALGRRSRVKAVGFQTTKAEPLPPRDDAADGGVVDELVGLGEEGRGGMLLGLAAGRGGGVAAMLRRWSGHGDDGFWKVQEEEVGEENANGVEGKEEEEVLIRSCQDEDVTDAFVSLMQRRFCQSHFHARHEDAATHCWIK